MIRFNRPVIDLPGAQSSRQNAANLAAIRPPSDLLCDRPGHPPMLVRVVEGIEARGFTGAPIYIANLSCGHQEADLSLDTIGWAI